MPDEPELDGMMFEGFLDGSGPRRVLRTAPVLLNPTTAHLERMAYALGLFPEGAAVPFPVLEILQDQWRAVLKASEPVMTYTKKG